MTAHQVLVLLARGTCPTGYDGVACSRLHHLCSNDGTILSIYVVRTIASASRLEDVPDTMFLMAEHLENKSWKNFMVGEKIAPNPTPKVYTVNGALYLADINYLMNTEQFFDQNSVIYEMPEDRAIDIDTDEDLHVQGTIFLR